MTLFPCPSYQAKVQPDMILNRILYMEENFFVDNIIFVLLRKIHLLAKFVLIIIFLYFHKIYTSNYSLLSIQLVGKMEVVVILLAALDNIYFFKKAENVFCVINFLFPVKYAFCHLILTSILDEFPPSVVFIFPHWPLLIL